MAKITYEDKVAVNVNPGISDINKVNADDMNEIKRVVNDNEIGNLITDGQIERAGYKIDNKDVYMCKKNFTMSGTGQNGFSVGLGTTGYTPLKYESFLNTGTALFMGNTPRSNGIEVANTQLFTYWNYYTDEFMAVSNGYDRTGAVIQVYLYFTYND